MEVRLRQLGKGVVEVDDGRQVVDAVTVRVAAPGALRGSRGQLAVDELGGVHAQVGIVAPQQRRHAGDQRRGHGGAAPGGIAVPGDGADDVLAGGVDLVLHAVEGGGIVVAEGGLHAVFVHAHDAQNVGVGGGVVGHREKALVGRAFVAGAGHQDAAGIGLGQGVLHGDGAGRAAEGHVDDVRAVVIGVKDGLGDGILGEVAAGHAGLHRHDLGVEGHAHGTLQVVDRRNDTGHVGAVAVVVHAVAPARDDVHAVVVVHVAVAVVVAAVAGGLLLVDPHVVPQVPVGEVHAGVDDSHHDAGVATRVFAVLLQPLPGLLDAAAVEGPLVCQHGVAVQQVFPIHGGAQVGLLVLILIFRLVDVVILRGHHIFQLSQALQRLGRQGAVCQAGQEPAPVLGCKEPFQAGHAGLRQQGRHFPAGVRCQLDQHIFQGIREILLVEDLRVCQVKWLGQCFLFLRTAGASGHGRRHQREQQTERKQQGQPPAFPMVCVHTISSLLSLPQPGAVSAQRRRKGCCDR